MKSVAMFKMSISGLHALCEAQFPFKRNRLRCVRWVNENRKKRKRLRWQAAKHGCHCFDRAFVWRLRLLRENASDCV